MILFINACVRPESRTKRLADCLLAKLAKKGDLVKEVVLEDIDFPKVDNAFLSFRDEQIANEDFSAPVFELAKDFAAADTIVIAAPFWDFSFPAMLKQYLEQICVTGITFCYEGDAPKGLCRAEKLFYVTTAGGMIYSEAFGYGYVKELAQSFFGIRECRFIKAEGLDIIGADVEGILNDAEESLAEALL